MKFFIYFKQNNTKTFLGLDTINLKLSIATEGEIIKLLMTVLNGCKVSKHEIFKTQALCYGHYRKVMEEASYSFS